MVISSAWLLYYEGHSLFENITSEHKLGKISEVRISKNNKTEIAKDERNKVFGDYFDDIFGLLKLKSNNVIVVGPLPPAILIFNRMDSLKKPIEIKKKEFDIQAEELTQLLKKNL